MKHWFSIYDEKTSLKRFEEVAWNTFNPLHDEEDTIFERSYAQGQIKA